LCVRAGMTAGVELRPRACAERRTIRGAHGGGSVRRRGNEGEAESELDESAHRLTDLRARLAAACLPLFDAGFERVAIRSGVVLAELCIAAPAERPAPTTRQLPSSLHTLPGGQLVPRPQSVRPRSGHVPWLPQNVPTGQVSPFPQSTSPGG